MKRYVRITLIVIASVVVFGVAGWFFAVWEVQRAFESAAQGGGLKQLADVLQATVGATLARSDSNLQLEAGASNVGAITYYQKNPQQLQRDKKYFETWHSALAIADSGRENGHQLSGWESSAAITWIAPSQKTDAWGHTFCVQSDQQQTIVVSPGPQALSSLDCNTLKVTVEELAQMSQGRLNPHASGALILLVKRSSNRGPTAAAL